MQPVSSDDPAEQWVVEEIRDGPEVENASIEVDVGLYEHHTPAVRYRFQFLRSEDGAGTIYLPGRRGDTAENKQADRNNEATFVAAQAVAEKTGTRVEMYVMSQEYLNSVARDSLEDLIGEVGQKEARELLENAVEEDRQ